MIDTRAAVMSYRSVQISSTERSRLLHALNVGNMLPPHTAGIGVTTRQQKEKQRQQQQNAETDCKTNACIIQTVQSYVNLVEKKLFATEQEADRAGNIEKVQQLQELLRQLQAFISYLQRAKEHGMSGPAFVTSMLSTSFLYLLATLVKEEEESV